MSDTLETLLKIVDELSLSEKMRLIGCLLQDLNERGVSLGQADAFLYHVTWAQKHMDALNRIVGADAMDNPKSLIGLWRDLDIQISEDDIAEARREMWGGDTGRIR